MTNDTNISTTHMNYYAQHIIVNHVVNLLTLHKFTAIIHIKIIIILFHHCTFLKMYQPSNK